MEKEDIMKTNDKKYSLGFIKKFLLTLSILSFLSFNLLSSDPVCSEKGIVTWVVDGDTIFVKLDQKTEKVRLLGIDTPEFHGKNGRSEYYAHEAFLFTKENLKNNTVCLVKDPLNERDTYGRLLRYVYIDGRLFNAELLEGGYAEVFYKAEHKKKAYFTELQEKARKDRRGIWKYKTKISH